MRSTARLVAWWPSTPTARLAHTTLSSRSPTTMVGTGIAAVSVLSPADAVKQAMRSWTR